MSDEETRETAGPPARLGVSFPLRIPAVFDQPCPPPAGGDQVPAPEPVED